jgi:hypothetical protein
MKLTLPSSTRPRGAKLFVLLCLALTPFVTMAQEPESIAIFTGAVTTPPQVDATNFLNEGIWEIATEAPFETANTLNYTNEGAMYGSVGWEFDYGPLPGGGRGMAENFFNDSPATIQAIDGEISNPYGQFEFLVSYLIVSATNIVNKGALIAGANGELVLTGTNVTLTSSDVETAPIEGLGSAIGVTNFVPDVANYSLFWSTNSDNLNSQTFWNGTKVSLPSFLVDGNIFNVHSYSNITNVDNVDNVNDACGAINIAAQIASFIPSTNSASTNYAFSPTNMIEQAVFLNLENSNITGQVRFSPGLNPTNGLTVSVRLTMASTNVVAQSSQTNTIYVVDTLVSGTNSGLAPDLTYDPYYTCSSTVYRPVNYALSRTDLGGYFANGSRGAGLPSSSFFFSPVYSNAVVPADYTAYAAYIDNLTSDQQSGAVVTNLGGRIIINADNLNLTRAGLSAQGDIAVQAANFLGSTGAVVSCQNLSYNLGAPGGNLNFTNLAAVSTTSQLLGNITVWSAAWTNFNIQTSNSVEFYVMVVDASSLTNQVPVTVQNLALTSSNMVVSDSMSVSNSLLFDGQSLTLDGNLTLSDFIGDWTYANAPTLLYFTNNGELFIPGDASFGNDGPTNYDTFVNNATGEIIAYSQTIDSDVLDLYGLDETLVGPFSATTESGTLLDAVIDSAQDIDFSADNLQVNQSYLDAEGALDFTVTSSLSDSGSASDNLFACGNGFNLFSWPAGATGDLLGTTFETAATTRQTVTHTWAARDLGATVAGFSNNAAIGSLVLSAGGNGTSFQEPTFIFSGTGASNGLYVDYLDLSHLTNYNFLDGTLVNISSNLTIYFASASINPTNLDGQFGGHLHYVSGFVSLTTVLSGISYNDSPGAFQLSINSAARQTNIIMASTNLVNWTPVYTNVGSFIFDDPNTKNFPRRFYRSVVPSP